MASMAVYPVGQGGAYEADRWNGPDEWGMEEGAWQREIPRPSQCQVRAFPNEDINGKVLSRALNRRIDDRSR